MGTTPKPMSILVIGEVGQRVRDKLTAMAAQKHTIVYADLLPHDLILGPRCWRMSDQLADYFDDAIVEGRKFKYPKGD